jgi:hypothetical protein
MRAAIDAVAPLIANEVLERVAKLVSDDHAKTWGAAQATPAIVIRDAIRALKEPTNV